MRALNKLPWGLTSSNSIAANVSVSLILWFFIKLMLVDGSFRCHLSTTSSPRGSLAYDPFAVFPQQRCIIRIDRTRRGHIFDSYSGRCLGSSTWVTDSRTTCTKCLLASHPGMRITSSYGCKLISTPYSHLI